MMMMMKGEKEVRDELTGRRVEEQTGREWRNRQEESEVRDD